jgi:hypothetical protein
MSNDKIEKKIIIQNVRKKKNYKKKNEDQIKKKTNDEMKRKIDFIK